MPAGETARLIASLELQDKLTSGLKKAEGAVGKFDSKWSKVSGKVKTGLVAGAAGATAFIAANVVKGIESLDQLENATTAVDGAIKQMGLTGQITGAQIAETANRIEASIGAAFDDKDITRATATLIRFGKVTPKNLTKAMEVMTDLAAQTGSVDSASKLLAKALADPEKAAGKLARSGVILTKEQQKQIKALVKVGDVAGAQALILGSLEKTTKGAAAATQGPYKRALSVLADVTEDAQRALAEGFLPVIERVADLLSTNLAKPEVMQQIRDFGKGLAQGLDKAVDFAEKIPWGTIGDSLRLAGSGAKAVLDAFVGMPPWVQTAVLTGWGLNKLSGGIVGDVFSELGKGLIKGVLGMNAGVVNINAGVVNGGGGGLPGTGGGGGKGGGSSPGAIVGSLGVAGLIVAAAVPIGHAFADALPASLKGPGGAGKSEAQTRNEAAQAIMNAKVATSTDVEKMRAENSSWLSKNHEAAGKIADDVTTARDAQVGAVGRAQSGISSATYAGAGIVAGAVRASRPIVTTNVTVSVTPAAVQKTATVTSRTGGGGATGGNAWPTGEKI